MAQKHTYCHARCHALITAVSLSDPACRLLGLSRQTPTHGSKSNVVLPSPVSSALDLAGKTLSAGDVAAAALYHLGFRVSESSAVSLIPDALLTCRNPLLERLHQAEQRVQMLERAAAISFLGSSAASQQQLATELLQLRAALEQAVGAGTILKHKLEELTAAAARERDHAAATCACLCRELVEEEARCTRVDLVNVRLGEKLEAVKQTRHEYCLDKHKAQYVAERACTAREKLKRDGLWLAAETDARFRKFLSSEPPPSQQHLAKLIDTQLRCAENKSGRCWWPNAILDWCVLV